MHVIEVKTILTKPAADRCHLIGWVNGESVIWRTPASLGVTNQAWHLHKSSARQRGVKFLLTFEQWEGWWLSELARRGPNARRGRSHGERVMCRQGDRGAYELGNIYCATFADNLADVDWWGQNKKGRNKGHNNK
jgi:hypothetical protein